MKLTPAIPLKLYKRKADPLAGFSYHKQDQPIKQLVNKT